MRMSVDADIELGRPHIACSGWPVDHADLEPFEAATHPHWKSGVVGRIAVDHGQRRPETAETIQDRLVLPIARVPHLVDRREAFPHEVEQRLDAVPSLGVADEPQPHHRKGA